MTRSVYIRSISVAPPGLVPIFRVATHGLRRGLYSSAALRLELVTGLADELLFHGDGAGAAGRALDAVAELADVDFQLGDGAAQGVAMHAQFAGGAALVAFIFLQHGQDETFLELAHAFRIKNIAAVHLQDKRFQLIFHAAFSLCYEFFTAPFIWAGKPGSRLRRAEPDGADPDLDGNGRAAPEERAISQPDRQPENTAPVANSGARSKLARMPSCPSRSLLPSIRPSAAPRLRRGNGQSR